jgi:feruloyl esterase
MAGDRRARNVAAVVFAASLLTGPAAAAPGCAVADLMTLGVPNVSVTAAESVAAADAIPPHCDLKGTLATDGEGAGPGSAGFEVKLPERWNGKFLFWGVGGFAGSLRPSANAVDQGVALGKGYATAVTDTGHQGGDLKWALTAPGVPNEAGLADFWYRATHQTTVAAKLLVSRFYAGRAIERAYFDGCSLGGHGGLTEAMSYPEDYDGVIAGDPYLSARLHLSAGKNVKAFLTAYLPPALLPAIDRALLKSCDAADGNADGLIQNPARCGFDPATMICRPGEAMECLTPAQADAVKRYLAPVTDTAGALIYPGQSVSGILGIAPGSITTVPPADPDAAEPWGGATPPGSWSFFSQVVKYWIERDPGFDANHGFPLAGSVVATPAAELYRARTGSGDVDRPEKLTRYLALGKKLLLYHGYSDPGISPYGSVRFYQELARSRGGAEKTAEQVRLFMVPGMFHCAGGPGPNSFDTLTALESWVERGVAPDAIVAAHYAGNDPKQKRERTMPLCPWPAAARYAGTGDVNDAESWSCPANHDMLESGENGRQAGWSGGE